MHDPLPPAIRVALNISSRIMPGGAWVIVIIFICVDVVIVGAMIVALRLMVQPVFRPYPPVEPRVGAMHRSMQGIGLDMFNFGMCYRITVDEEHLHLQPNALAKLVGMPPASIPWQKLINPRMAMLSAKAGLDGHTLAFPKWCLRERHPLLG